MRGFHPVLLPTLQRFLYSIRPDLALSFGKDGGLRRLQTLGFAEMNETENVPARPHSICRMLGQFITVDVTYQIDASTPRPIEVRSVHLQFTRRSRKAITRKKKSNAKFGIQAEKTFDRKTGEKKSNFSVRACAVLCLQGNLPRSTRMRVLFVAGGAGNFEPAGKSSGGGDGRKHLDV